MSLSNRSPVAVDDFVTSGVSGIGIEILANDSDANGDEMTVIWFSLAENGTVSLDGSVITYVPNPGFSGNDSFDYQIEDPEGESDIATVTVMVEGWCWGGGLVYRGAKIADHFDPIWTQWGWFLGWFTIPDLALS